MVVNTSETTSMAHLIDWPAKKIVANILVPPRPRFAEFKPDGSELWVSSEVGGKVSVIDPVKKAVTQTIGFDVPGLRKEQIQPVGIRFTSDGKLGFVALGPANRVAVIDGKTKAVLKYLLVGQRVWHLALTPDDKLLFATNGVSNDVSVIDVGSAEGLEIDRRRLLPLGRGDHQAMNARTTPSKAATLPAALAVEHVSHAYGARKALDDVSFEVAPATFAVLIGLNGAGKSTLFSIITHLYAARGGSVSVFGFDVARQSGAALARIGVVFQSRTLDLDLTVDQNLRYQARAAWRRRRRGARSRQRAASARRPRRPRP